MEIGLWSDNHNFPSLPLMKISAWHKAKGDKVEFVFPLKHYDKIYVSKAFGFEYSRLPEWEFNADEIVFGGTGFSITVENGKEVYHKDKDPNLPQDIEHIYPDYSLYPEYTENIAYGFLTRGCPNNCPFCPVSQKEGRCSVRVASTNEFWRDQKKIVLLDANVLACRERIEILNELANTGARIEFNQGLDARFITDDVAYLLKKIKKDKVHFAFDLMENEKNILNGLERYAKIVGGQSNVSVYILTNYNTSHEEDIYRVKKVIELGFLPDVRVYRKPSAPQITTDLQRWCNNRFIFKSSSWEEYIPRSDGKTISQLYYGK